MKVEELQRELDALLEKARKAGVKLSDRCVSLQCALEYLKQYGDQ